MRTDREAGRKIRLLMQGKKADTFEQIQRDLDAEVFDWTEEFNFGTVWTRPGLSFEDRILIAIAIQASLHGPIRNYLHGAIQAGIDPKRIHETLVMLTPYAGMSVAMDALQIWGDVVRSERRRGNVVDCPVQDTDIAYKKPS
jgi:4-carboxymuconolactone decarboxylase